MGTGPGVDGPVLGGRVVEVGHRQSPRRHRCARVGGGHLLDRREGVVERPQHRGHTVVHGLLVDVDLFLSEIETRSRGIAGIACPLF